MNDAGEVIGVSYVGIEMVVYDEERVFMGQARHRGFSSSWIVAAAETELRERWSSLSAHERMAIRAATS